MRRLARITRSQCPRNRTTTDNGDDHDYDHYDDHCFRDDYDDDHGHADHVFHADHDHDCDDDHGNADHYHPVALRVTKMNQRIMGFLIGQYGRWLTFNY